MEVDVRDLPYYIRVIRVTPLSDHRIDVEFEDGNRGIYDMTPLLDKGVFKALRDDALFNRVHVACGVVTWNLYTCPSCTPEHTSVQAPQSSRSMGSGRQPLKSPTRETFCARGAQTVKRQVSQST